MAKFGTQKSEYDPFGQISGTLAELDNSSGGAAQDKVQEPDPEPKHAPDPVLEREIVKTGGSRETEVKPAQIDNGEQGDTQVRHKEPSVQKESLPSALKVIKRFKTTKEEAIKIDRATVNLAAQLGLRMDTSKLTRALWEIYLTHEQEILRSVQHVEGLAERPSNRDAIALAEFDEQLAALIGEGLMMACMRSRRGQ